MENRLEITTRKLKRKKKKKNRNVCKAGSRCIRVSLCFQISYRTYICMFPTMFPSESSGESCCPLRVTFIAARSLSLSLSLCSLGWFAHAYIRVEAAGCDCGCWCDPAPWLGCFSGPRPRLVVIRNRRRYSNILLARD